MLHEFAAERVGIFLSYRIFSIAHDDLREFILQRENILLYQLLYVFYLRSLYSWQSFDDI